MRTQALSDRNRIKRNRCESDPEFRRLVNYDDDDDDNNKLMMLGGKRNSSQKGRAKQDRAEVNINTLFFCPHTPDQTEETTRKKWNEASSL